MTSSSPALGVHSSSPIRGETGMDALCLSATTMPNTNNDGSFIQASSLSSLQRALGGSAAAGSLLQQQLLGSNLENATDINSFLQAVSSASKQLQEKREQLQQQRLAYQLLMQQQQPQTAATPNELQLLESLLKARSNPASTVATDNQAATAAALAAAAAAGSSPLSPAEIGLSTSNLQRAVSNLSGCSTVTNLQHALSGIPGLQSSLFGMSGPSLQGQLSGQPALQRTLTVAESATAADLLSRLEAIKAAAGEAAGSPQLAASQQQQGEAVVTHPAGSTGTPPDHQQSGPAAGTAAAAAAPCPAAAAPSPRAGAAADVDDEDDPELLAGRVGSNTSCASHRFSRAQMVSRAQQMLLGQINQQKQQQQQPGLSVEDLAVAGPAAAAAAVVPARSPPATAVPALSNEQAPSGISMGDLEGLLMRSAPGMQAAAAAAAATTTTCTSGVAAEIARSGSVVGPAAAFYDAVQLQKVLDDVVATKKQAAACIKEAVALGLLPQFLLKCLRNTSTPTASGATAAVAALAGGPSSSSGAQVQPASAGKRPRDSEQQTADEAARPAKLHRLASSSGAEAAAAAEAAAPAAAGAEAAVPAASEARSSRHLDRNLSHASSDTAIPAVNQQQQQVEPMEAQAGDAVDPSAAALPAAPAALDAAAGASELGLFGLQQSQGSSVMSPQGRDLFLRTLMAVSRSQRLCKQLAYMAIPAANEAAAARNVAVQLQQQQAQQQQPLVELQALQQAVQQLRQQMVLAKASINVKQQALLRMQQEAQAAANAHTQQLDAVGQAVSKLMELAKDEGLRPSDRQRLVHVCSDILKAVVRN